LAGYIGVNWHSSKPSPLPSPKRRKPERMAALAMLTVVGLLVYTVIQWQVRLYLITHDQQLPGTKGETATPTAAVVFTRFSPVVLVPLQMGSQEVYHMYGVQPHHLLICDALGLNYSWYEAPAAHKNVKRTYTP
jgi:hypothetical protein